MPKGLKPVRRRLATGEVRLYWYHRATGTRLQHDPRSAEGMLEVSALDRRASSLEAAQKAASGTLAALWDAYASRESPEWTGLKPRTRSDYQRVRDWLGAGAERARVRSIQPADIMRLRDKAYRAHGRRFANYVVTVLGIMLKWGRLRGWCDGNPAQDVPSIRRPTGARKVNRAWSMAEVAAFAHAAPPQLLVPFALGLFAGMRQGDTLIVTWRAIVGERLEWIAGKNGEPCEVQITGPLKTVLDEARARRGSAVQIAVNSKGEPWSQSGFRASFFKLVRALVAEGGLQPGCTFHGLRHTLGAFAANDGHSDRQIAAAIGDRNPAMAQIYARDADKRSARAVILDAVQKRFANVDWKTGTENAPGSTRSRVPKVGKNAS